jgi:hypothetical protein
VTRLILAHDPDRRTNAQAIADLAELGILRRDDDTVDLSLGPKAGFWRIWRPDLLVTNDPDPKVDADYGFDVRTPPWPANRFQVAVWDGPYGYRGTASDFDLAYGTSDYNTPQAIDDLLVAGTITALHLASRVALVKCQDQNIASRFRGQSDTIIAAAREAGADVVAKLYVTARRGQPAGKTQLNVWGYHSVLLVFG